MKQALINIGKWTLLLVMSCIGMVLLIIATGEDDPNMTISFLAFMLLKALTLIGIVLLYQAGKWLNSRGYLPDLKKHFIDG